MSNPETDEIVLVHSSDLHIDDDLGIRDYNGLIGLAAVLLAARDLAADAVLLAGDTFDNHRISDPVLKRAGMLISAAGRRVVLLPGNHDPVLPNSPFIRAGLVGMPDVHVLGMSDASSIVLDRHGLEIWGHAHQGHADMAPLRAPRPRRTRWQVVMAHGHYVAPADYEREAHRAWKLTDADIAATGADYVALGHWDRAAAVGKGMVPAFYSGSPDLAQTVNVVRLGAAGVRIQRHRLRWNSCRGA